MKTVPVAAAAALVAASAAAVWAGVATIDADAAGVKAAPQTDAQICASPKNQNGTLKIGLVQAATSSWDPIRSGQQVDIQYLRLAYDTLTRIDAHGNATPELATSWKYSDGGTKLSLTLRNGLVFSDGTPLDASAAAQSLKRTMAPPSTLASTLADVSSVTADGPQTVVITLSQPDYQIPQILGGRSGLIVSPTAFTSNPAGLATKPVGAGPYRMVSNQEGGVVTFERNPTYWNRKNVHLANVVVNNIVDEATRISAIRSGQLNFGTFFGSSVAPLKAAGLKVVRVATLFDRYLNINGNAPPFNDGRLVSALNYAIDRKALVNALEAGYGIPNWQPFPPGYVAYNPKLNNRYPYNPQKAKQMLAASGHPNGIDLTLAVTQSENYPMLAEIVQAQLKKVGINVTFQPVPIAELPQINYIDHRNVFFTDGFAGRESPLLAMSVIWGPKGLLNPGRQYPPSLAKAITAAAAVPVTDSRYPKLLQRATLIGVQSQPRVWLMSVALPVVMGANVHGFTPNPDYLGNIDGVCVAS